jgi:hypothetical protein
MYHRPHEPSRKSTHEYLAALQDGKALTDDGQISFVEVVEQFWSCFSFHSSSYELASIASLLHRYLRNSRKGSSILVQGRGIANNENVWMVEFVFEVHSDGSSTTDRATESSHAT